MTTCLESIAVMGSFESLQEVTPNTAINFSTTSTQNRLFKIKSPLFQSVHFNVSLSGNIWNTIFTIYSWNGTTATSIGSVSITNGNVSFSMDFPIGDYILCVRSGGVQPQSGQFVAAFTGYAQQAKLDPSFYSGETASSILTTPRPPQMCNQPLSFKILEGDLPPGLTMNSQGTIRGLLPNLDGLQDRLSPAVNWFYDQNDGVAWPWGRMWRFRVKVWIAGFEETTFDEEWFCIRIHNNWTFDANRFLADAPFQQIKDIVITQSPNALPQAQCVPCVQVYNNTDPFIPIQIDKSKGCLPCQESIAEQVQLIQIPLQISNIEAEDILAWYDFNKVNRNKSPQIEQFLNALEESTNFQILRSKAGYVQDTTIDAFQRQTTFIAISKYMNFLQLAQVRLDPDSDPQALQYQIREWRKYQNQVLPMSTTNWSGETMTIEELR